MNSVSWQMSSHTLELAASNKGCAVLLKIGSFAYQTSIEGLPSISLDKLTPISFKENFYPVVSRVGNDWRVRFYPRGPGGCFSCLFGSSAEEKKPLNPSKTNSSRQKKEAASAPKPRQEERKTADTSVKKPPVSIIPIANPQFAKKPVASAPKTIESLNITEKEWELLHSNFATIQNVETGETFTMGIEGRRAYIADSRGVKRYMSEKESFDQIEMQLRLYRLGATVSIEKE